MKLLSFSLIVIAVIFTLGCSAENPICSTNFCAVGEVFPRSELEEGQAFSEVDIDDSAIFGKLVGATVEPPKTTLDTDVNIIDTDLSTVTASLKADEPTFKGAFISVHATVDRYTPNGSALHLRKSHVNDPEWIVRMFVKDYHFDISSIFANDGTSHNFTLWVSGYENNTIFCRAVDPSNIASGRSILHDNGKIINTTVSEVVNSMQKGESYFIFKKIVITAPVVHFRKSTIERTGQKYEAVHLIEWESDVLDEKANHTFSIYPNASLWTEFNQNFVVGVTYRFELIVHYLSGRDFFDPKDIDVVTYLAE